MKVLFVDHAFHRKTQSSRFFIDLLAPFFDVDVHHVDPASEDDPLAGIPTALDLVLIWQMDYLAPAFIAAGHRVVVVPMYDGSSTMPEVHWLWSRQARFINFSRRLHHQVVRTGADSLLTKFYKPPRRRADQRPFERLNVLLWQRRPEHGLNLRLVERILGDQIASVHLHDCPDDPLVDTAPYREPGRPGYRLTRSTWFSDASDYGALLDEHNVYIAPRRSEGIGMGFIEAMANGMLVLATAESTHDEYISNWINGLLIDPDTTGYADVADRAAAIGRMAWKSCELGHARWLASIPGIIDFIRTTPRPEPAPSLDPAALGRAISRAYYAGTSAYTYFLVNHPATLEHLLPATLRKSVRVQVDGRMAPPRRAGATRPLAADPDRGGPGQPWLAQNRFDATLPSAREHILSDNVRLGEGCAWIVGDGASLGFRLDPRPGAATHVDIAYRTTGLADGARLRYVLTLNQWTLAEGAFDAADGMVGHPVPAEQLRQDNVLRIQLLPGGAPPAGGLRPGLGITRIAFS